MVPEGWVGRNGPRDAAKKHSKQRGHGQQGSKAPASQARLRAAWESCSLRTRRRLAPQPCSLL